eukprot:scaffold204049_cov32-Tisochrysis_lutea.AAC.2
MAHAVQPVDSQTPAKRSVACMVHAAQSADQYAPPENTVLTSGNCMGCSASLTLIDSMKWCWKK